MNAHLPHKIAMAVNRAEENCFKKGVGTTKSFNKLRIDLSRLIPESAPACTCGQEEEHRADCALFIWAKKLKDLLSDREAKS